MSLYLGTNLISGVATPVEGARNIGQIVQSTIPLTDAGLHLLDGALISGSGSYADFVSYIASIYDASANYFCSEADWQTAVSTYGVCGKFVYDSVNNTVRLPKYNSKFYSGGGIANAKGNGMTLGLTNGSQNGGVFYGGGYYFYPSPSAYGKPASTTTYSDGTNTGAFGVTTDSSKSGVIADLSTITTSLDGYWYIVIATSVKTQIEVDIDEIATDLNGKADVDLTNCTKPHIVETYVNGTSWYRVYSDGWCEQGGDFGSAYTPYTNKTIIFVKEFTDTNYNLHIQSATVGNAYTPSINALTTTSFTAGNTVNNNALARWKACGYIIS